MEYDSSYNHEAADWNLPSPSATPTSASFNSGNVYHTPKASSMSSHFHDAFSTPQMPTFATPRQPESESMTPLQRQQTSSETLRSNYYANLQASNGGALPVQAMQPPVQAGFHSLAASPMHEDQAQLASARSSGGMSFESMQMQMQTPPPTRGTSVKKRQSGQPTVFGTPSTIASRRFMTPQQNLQPSQVAHMPIHPAPMHFPQLQFPPDVYQFGNLGPMTTPVHSQTQPAWGQTNGHFLAPHDTLDDPFAPTPTLSVGWPTVPLQSGPAQAVPFDTPAMDSFPVQPPHPRPRSAAPLTSHLPHQTTAEMLSTSVDPSLVYSSPLRPPPLSATRTNPSRGSAVQAEPKRNDSSLVNHSRSNTISSTDSLVSSSGLRRSNTTGSTRPQSMYGGTDFLHRSNSLLQVPRTASPLKRTGKSFLGSISESRKARTRTSIVLTIDENGRARTETKRLDDSPTRSMRERYPGLFDSDSSDDDSERSDPTPSRSTSFSFGKPEERKHKAARLEPPVENLEGLSIPRSSSSTSMNVVPSRAAMAAAAQLRRTGSLRKKTPSRNSQKRTGSSTNSLIDTCPMDASDHTQAVGGAADLAHHNLPDSFHSQTWANSTLDAHNRRWSMLSLEQQQPRPSSISPTHQYGQQPFGPPTFPPSPTPVRQIRCRCGVANDNGQQLLQCASCTQWSHASCVGPSPATLPLTFICFLCTKPAPSRRVR